MKDIIAKLESAVAQGRGVELSPSQTATLLRKFTPSERQVESLVVDEDLRRYAMSYNQDAESLLEDWRLHCRANGYKTGRNPIRDARSMFMRWIRNAPPRKSDTRRVSSAPVLSTNK